MKRWYKNPLAIALIVLAASWFAWTTKTGMIVSSKADDSAVKILEKKVDASKELAEQKLATICEDINELKNAIKTHEEKQDKQVGKIYDMLIQMSRENKSSFRENKENRR